MYFVDLDLVRAKKYANIEEKTISSETLKTVMMTEIVSERKKFIFVSASWKFSHVILTGSESGFSRISGFSFTELTKTKRNGVT